MAVYIEELRRRMREQVGRSSLSLSLPPSLPPSIFALECRLLTSPSRPLSLPPPSLPGPAEHHPALRQNDPGLGRQGTFDEVIFISFQ